MRIPLLFLVVSLFAISCVELPKKITTESSLSETHVEQSSDELNSRENRMLDAGVLHETYWVVEEPKKDSSHSQENKESSFSEPLTQEKKVEKSNLPELQPDNIDPKRMYHSKGCQTGLVSPSSRKTYSIRYGGLTRLFQVYLPTKYSTTSSWPVVVDIHQLGDTALGQVARSEFPNKGNSEGFITVAPQSGLIPPNSSWNAGDCCAPAHTMQVDDVGFVGKILDILENDYCIDKSRIYADGISNGGALAQRLGCEMNDRFAAVAGVATGLLFPQCNPTRTVPYIGFHGTADTLSPYYGVNIPGTKIKALSFRKNGEFWAKNNGCDMSPQTTFKKKDVTCITFSGCKDNAEVVLCSILLGGHSWPGSWVPGVGYTSQTIHATDTIWKFFKKYQRK